MIPNGVLALLCTGHGMLTHPVSRALRAATRTADPSAKNGLK